VFGPNFVVDPLGIFFSAPDTVAPRNVTAINDYTGIYFSDTFDVNDRLSLTGGGRYNLAVIRLQDNTGDFPGIDYVHFNPMAGATYKINPANFFSSGMIPHRAGDTLGIGFGISDRVHGFDIDAGLPAAQKPRGSVGDLEPTQLNSPQSIINHPFFLPR
jgi:iron complex outermembrane recepter protein